MNIQTNLKTFLRAVPAVILFSLFPVFEICAAPNSLNEKETAMEIDRIMQNFYLAPSPEKASAFLRLLSAFNERKVTQTQPCTGVFLGEVFSRYPEHLQQWIRIKGHKGYRMIVEYALLYARTDEAKAAYCKFTGTDFKKIPAAPADVSSTKWEECSPSTLDSCWGGFFASGKKKYLDTVIAAALYPVPPHMINLTQRAALWSLLGLCDKHPMVKEHFRESLGKAYPQVQYSLAKQISEQRQKELLGKVLISDAEKDKNDSEEQKRERKDTVKEGTRLKPEFFDALRNARLSYQSDYLARAAGLFRSEVKEKFPDLPEKEIDRITWNHLLLKDMALPRKPARSDASFIEFYAIRIYMKNKVANSRQKKFFLDSGLRLGQKYRNDLTVAQMVFRELEATGVIWYLTPDMLRRFRLHPYLSLMLQGEHSRQQGWNHRGGGYADTVSSHGRQSFREYLRKARNFFEEAGQKYPSVPEAAAKMIDVIGSGCGEDSEMLVWFKRALQAQADYAGAVRGFTWYSRPRWGGSAAQLLTDAKAFFRQRENNVRLAQNGIYLLQAFLSEIPYIDGVRYFHGERNYEEVKELFENLSKIVPLDSSQKLFYGTVALFADDTRTADEIAAKLTPADLAFAKRPIDGSIPQIHWVDFPVLHRALKRTGLRGELLKTLYYKNKTAAEALLKKTIPNIADPADKQALIDLYIALAAKIDRLTFRTNMPMFIRLCAEPEENMTLIKEVIAMGTDLNVSSPTGKRRPLFYAMEDKKSGELLDLLLKSGADPNAMWGDHTPLDYACHYRFSPARIRRLLEGGADPDKKYLKSFTPLHAAFRNLEAAKLLVEFGAKLNEVSEFGQTPLDLAEKMGSPEVVRFLKSKGAKHASEL